MAFTDAAIYYTFDDEQVHFESIQRLPEIEEGE
jgi:hypothetical protein